MARETLTIATAGSALIQACEKAGVVVPRSLQLPSNFRNLLICASDGKQVSIEGMYGSLGKLK